MAAEITLETVSLIYCMTVLMRFLSLQTFLIMTAFQKFFSEELLREQVTSECDEKLQDLDKDDPFYFSMHENITQKYEEDLEAIEQFIRKKKKRKFNNSPVIESIEKKKLEIVKIFEKIKWLLNLSTRSLLQ